jgi:hypothetical protein
MHIYIYIYIYICIPIGILFSLAVQGYNLPPYASTRSWIGVHVIQSNQTSNVHLEGLCKFAETDRLPYILRFVLYVRTCKIPIHAEGKTGNAFRDALRRISAEHEFQLIVRGLVKLLNNPHQANNTLLPSSMKQIACFQEVCMMHTFLICAVIEAYTHTHTHTQSE